MASNMELIDERVKVCPACTSINSSTALVCFACNTELADLYDDAHSKWICVKCTFKNKESCTHCEICESKRGTQLPTREVLRESRKSLSSTPPKPKRPAFNRQESSLSEDFRAQEEQKLTLRLGDLFTFCAESKILFEDSGFPALRSSIYTKKEAESGVSIFKDGADISHWSRPNQVVVNRSDRGCRWTLFNEPKSTDIVQGILGNCWFASALSVLAENRVLLEKIFVSKEVNSKGVYAMRLCKGGKWVDVIVDDRLPCLSNSHLAFCKGKRKQLWVPLIEKAMAKIFGSYSALNSGTTQEGLAILTGFPCESLDFDSIKREETSGAGDGLDVFWARLLSSMESKLLLGCSSGNKNVQREELTGVGLVSNHAYSVLDVQLVHGEKLLRLRNTWGRFAWTGNWSEKSHCWDLVPSDVKSKLSIEGSEEGLFWISLDDWLKYFSSVHICYVREGGHEARLSSKFPNCQDSVLNCFRLFILDRTDVDLSLHQQSTRGESSQDMVDILIVVFDDHWRLISHTKRSIRGHVTCSVVLEPGSYNIYCLSFTRWNAAEHFSYTLVCHSRQPVLMEQLVLPKTTIAEALIRLVMTAGVLSMCDDTALMTKYTLDRGWSGQIVVAINKHPSRFFHIKCDWTESTNLVHSRELTTMDVVPPMKSQVLNILTQLERTAAFSLRCKQKFVGSRFPNPQVWGYKTDHSPAITEDVSALHGPIST